MIILCLVFLLPISVSAQDTVQYVERVKPIPQDSSISPVGAAIRSAILPGWGQWYTNHPVKALIIGGTFGASIGTTIYYHSRYARENEKIAEYERSTGTPAPLAMIQIREYYRDLRDQFLIISTIIYAIAILDAYVDAYLVPFDVSPDLSIRISPFRFECLVSW